MYISQHASEWQNWSQSLYCYPLLYGTKHVRLQWHHFRQSWGGLRAELQILIRPQSLWAPVSLSVWRLVGLDHFYVSLSPKSLHKSTLIKVWKERYTFEFFFSGILLALELTCRPRFGAYWISSYQICWGDECFCCWFFLHSAASLSLLLGSSICRPMLRSFHPSSRSLVICSSLHWPAESLHSH